MASERELSHRGEFSIVCVENARDEICACLTEQNKCVSLSAVFGSVINYSQGIATQVEVGEGKQRRLSEGHPSSSMV